MPNRLATSQSLYLRQHANNPVDWYPWGPEALERAKALDRPIFLSVGYSACHWCHVMERESFEDEATAAVLNSDFVPVKVDREERPDLDQIYMTALQLLTREGGGWPLSVWLTPDLAPFHAGTYFPPRDNHGRPGFRRVLAAVTEAWKIRRAEIDAAGDKLKHALSATSVPTGDSALSPAVLESAAKVLGRNVDRVRGGFGHAPKFPHAADLAVLLRAGDVEPVRLTLTKMARGGVCDQVGGGFHRYSTDAAWLVPHFEKMLYDNAQLAPLYAEAWLATGNDEFRQIARETLDYVLKEMTSPDGAFYATQDADTEGEEGKFFVWSEAEIDAALGSDSAFARAVFGVTRGGNFGGHNILYRKRSDAEDAAELKLPLPEFRESLAAVKQKLYGWRSQRVRPGRDEKILSGWNGLMISAFARCGAALGEGNYVAVARRAAGAVRATHMNGEKLLRTPGIDGFLEDYACTAASLVELYETDFDLAHLDRAVALLDNLVADFWDEAGGGFFIAPADRPDVIARTKDLHDGSIPAGNAVAALTLLKLSHLLGRADYREKAERTLGAYAGLMTDSPMAAGAFLLAADWLLKPVEEVTVVGDAASEETQEVLGMFRTTFSPRRLVAYHDPAKESPLPIFAFRPMIDGRVTVYFCFGQTCSAPLIGPEAVRQFLAAKSR